MTEGQKTRWIWPVAIGTVVILLAVIALNREPAQLDPDTPEGTVQAYLQAIGDSDFEAALALLDPEYYESCDAADLASSMGRSEPFTAVLDLEGIEDLTEEKTFVPVRMQFGTSGPFGSGWTSWENFVVTNYTGSWLITEEAWPYFGWDCREGGL